MTLYRIRPVSTERPVEFQVYEHFVVRQNPWSQLCTQVREMFLAVLDAHHIDYVVYYEIKTRTVYSSRGTFEIETVTFSLLFSEEAAVHARLFIEELPQPVPLHHLPILFGDTDD